MKPRKNQGQVLSLIVLAGGKSRRMGRDKAFLHVGAATLLEETVRPLEDLFDEVLIAVSPGQAVPSLPWRTVEDDISGQGPLRGILTGLRGARNDSCFVLACDAPGLSPAVVRKIVKASVEADIVIAVTDGHLKEPLLGVYRKSVIPEIESLLRIGERSILRLFDRVKIGEVRLARGEIPANINTPEEFRAIAGKKKR